MKIVDACIGCGSTDLSKKLGFVQPFIAHLVLDYPLAEISINGSRNMHPILFANSVRCNRCTLVFSQVRYDGEEMAKIYRGYRGEDYARLRERFEPGYYALNALIGKGDVEVANRAAAMRAFLDGAFDAAAVRTVLDYGGDKGQHIPALFSGARKFVYEVSGAEAVDGVTLVQDLKALGPMDFILNCNVLEHLPYPGEVLEAIRGLCTPDTLLFFDVPFERHDNDYPIHFHEHINFFNAPSLAELLRTHGFAVRKIDTVSMDLGWCSSRNVYALAGVA